MGLTADQKEGLIRWLRMKGLEDGDRFWVCSLGRFAVIRCLTCREQRGSLMTEHPEAIAERFKLFHVQHEHKPPEQLNEDFDYEV